MSPMGDVHYSMQYRSIAMKYIMLFLSGYYHNVNEIYAVGHVHIHLLFHKEVYRIIDHQNVGKVLCRKNTMLHSTKLFL